ncbi:NAD(P)H-hydrate epimerase [Erythrobacter sp. LQ02-29]|uniref:NAD(P)H-hydrate epimerase n=1 Tax=Erythrobacter sp. LQ02-29 TaxID=2920384 RepID=UPI001F4D3B69|nr:NAD(P)H-hydrate epimerase [Erythrobacter sp. LQ02-29]MCP9223062.1 NAD(P)H-hydrate epimerase [Erythrobacter sp. LQ02-29]
MPADPVLTANEMRRAEQRLVEQGISERELMQRAGEGAAHWVWRLAAGRAVTVLCGPGNNGGDGYVIAAELARRGGEVRVVAPLDPATDTAKAARDHCPVDVSCDGDGANGAVFVDALFGSGLSRPLSDDLQALVATLHEAHDHAVAIDLPSGVETDRGRCLNRVPEYDLTLALGAWKIAHFTGEGALKTGELRLVDIGVEHIEEGRRLTQAPRFRAPEPDAYKYTRGLLAVVGGEMPGAALLASHAAMGAGAGYVKLLASHSHPDVPADLVLDESDLSEALRDDHIRAILAGPGLGRSERSRERLAAVLGTGARAVLDADALHLLDPDMLEGVDATRLLLTPHEGELAKLCEAFEVDGDTKLDRALALHDAIGAAVLAKGPDTLLVAEGDTLFFPRGPSWLSVAGTGDVLAGTIASRLATGDSITDAATAGVFLQHRAATLAGPAFSARDLAEAVQEAFAQFL